VTIDTSDNFSLGVDLSSMGHHNLLAFTSYGLSKVDPVSGALSLIPGAGFNGAVIDPNSAEAVLHSLSSHSRAKVLSAPRILVNDNATGVLTSVSEVPYTSVNASQTVATTSFAGFAKAGTTINVTPHIGEADHVQLEYTVTLNSFTGTGASGVPPPRQTDEVESKVVVPDGHTIIVGRLNRKNPSKSVSGLAYLTDIPIVGALFSNRNKSQQSTSMFVFLRPIILRDDKFQDLKFLSEADLGHAHVHGDMPKSEPLVIH
jgi:general secretion pathway protein D